MIILLNLLFKYKGIEWNNMQHSLATCWVYVQFGFMLPCTSSPIPFPSKFHPCGVSCSLFLSATKVRSLSLSAPTHDWRQQAWVSLKAMSNQMEKSDACKIVRLFVFLKGGKHFFPFFPSQVFAYKWQPAGCQGRGVAGERVKWQMKMKCHGRKVQRRQEERELFYLFVGQHTEDGR